MTEKENSLVAKKNWSERIIKGAKYRHKKSGRVKTFKGTQPFYGKNYVHFKEDSEIGSGRVCDIKNFFKHYERVKNDKQN